MGEADYEVFNTEGKTSRPYQQVLENTGDAGSENMEVGVVGNELFNTEGKKSRLVSWRLKSKKPIFYFRM